MPAGPPARRAARAWAAARGPSLRLRGPERPLGASDDDDRRGAGPPMASETSERRGPGRTDTRGNPARPAPAAAALPPAGAAALPAGAGSATPRATSPPMPAARRRDVTSALVRSRDSP